MRTVFVSEKIPNHDDFPLEEEEEELTGASSLLDPTPYVRARLLLLQKFGKPLLHPNYSGGHVVR
jgi:hypothetical protein